MKRPAFLMSLGHTTVMCHYVRNMCHYVLKTTNMQTPRLVSLDVLRGLTVMLMIFVNNGAGPQIFSTLQHSKWNGMTPCDLVFPFFLFMVGISTYLSLGRCGFEWSAETAHKIAKRTVTLFLIGLAINWFDMACDGRPSDFAHLRIMGVMQRIALCYSCTALTAVGLKRLVGSTRTLPYVAIALLLSYTLLIVLGRGYDHNASTNILALADSFVLGHAHLYHKSPVDPEGLLSTLPAIAHTMIGFWVAAWATGQQADDPQTHRLNVVSRLMVAGALLVFAGYLLTFAMPLNKRIWSPSYVCVTCGFAALAQGLLVYLIDLRRPALARHVCTRLTLVFGTNPLFLYVASEMIAILLGATGLKDTAYHGLHSLITDGYIASLFYATLFVAAHAWMGYELWRRKIYIKL